MRVVHKSFAVLGALWLAGCQSLNGVYSLETEAFSSAQSLADLQREAELACEVALEENTIEALEAYLRDYPNATTACRALALNALNGFGPGGPQDAGNPPPASNGYGG